MQSHLINLLSVVDSLPQKTLKQILKKNGIDIKQHRNTIRKINYYINCLESKNDTSNYDASLKSVLY